MLIFYSLAEFYFKYQIHLTEHELDPWTIETKLDINLKEPVPPI